MTNAHNSESSNQTKNTYLQDLAEIKKQQFVAYQLAWNILLATKNTLYPGFLLFETKNKAPKPIGARVNNLVKYVVIEDKSDQSMSNLLNEIRWRLNQFAPVYITPTQFSDLPLDMRKDYIIRLGKYNDTHEYEKLQKVVAEHGIISQSPLWRDALEHDADVSLLMEKLRSGILDEQCLEFLDYRGVINKKLKNEIIEIAKNLFPRYCVASLNAIKDGRDSDLVIKAFIYDVLYDSLGYEDAAALPKVIKVSGTSFGQGVTILSAEEILELRKIDNQQSQIEEIVQLIVKKLTDRGMVCNSENILEFLLKGKLAIKEFLPGFGGNSHGLNIVKIHPDDQTNWQYCALMDTTEIKDEYDRWAGTSIDLSQDLATTLKGSNLEGKVSQFISSIELLHYLAGKLQIDRISEPKDFQSERLLLSGLDWAIISDVKGNKIVKAVEFAGRYPASTNIILELKRRQNDDEQINKCSYYKTCQTKLSLASISQNISQFIEYLGVEISELDGKSLSSVVSITGINAKNPDNLVFGLVLYNDFCSEKELIISLLNNFISYI